MSEAEYRKKYPKCVPERIARTMTERQIESAIARKRSQGKPKGGKPTMVSTIVRKP
jgi:DNA invertase Pin-like site-specific DNA recombinase